MGTDTDGIDILPDLLKLAFVDKKCRNIKVVTNGGELTRYINQKKTSDVSQA